MFTVGAVVTPPWQSLMMVSFLPTVCCTNLLSTVEQHHRSNCESSFASSVSENNFFRACHSQLVDVLQQENFLKCQDDKFVPGLDTSSLVGIGMS